MKDPLNRTKVVLRHLPPSISQSALTGQIDGSFAGRYNWVCSRQAKNRLLHLQEHGALNGFCSQKNQLYSHAYIDFKRPEDVVEFAEYFDGHVFVNEKGTQYKTIVEYSPSQRVPNPWSKKDGREGTISKDPEYLEFLDFLAKPVETLPSAEIQLERREAERGAPKETVIVTPLMDFVRQKRAAKSGSQRSSTNGKLSRRAGGASPGNSSSSSAKRGSEKRRGPTSMYVLRDSTKRSSGKEKSTYLLLPRQEHLSDKSILVAVGTGVEILEDDTVPVTDGTTSGASGAIETGKKRLLLPKLKKREVSHTLPVRNSPDSTTLKQNQRCEASGRVIRSILLNKEPRQNQSPAAVVQSEQQMPTLNIEKDKRPPRPSSMHSVLKDHITSISLASCIPDCDTKRALYNNGVGNDLRGDVEDIDSNNSSSLMKSRKMDMGIHNSWGAEIKILGNGRSALSLVENGSHKHVGRRGLVLHGLKEVDGSLNISEGKSSKRGGVTGYGSHEKQVWVQKSGSGT
ncbi:regulator of nonsense transcripts UPF3-like isoform X2 [Tasmannia lanceolata]|uniref:regulator of nonsense transcripts UPF3-like isoform X2 n=1 Tax=Tasmannia lanceolata TaxID=3420 RepID=UPI00406325B9